jgi:hypothetical protein
MKHNNINDVRLWAIFEAVTPIKLYGVWIRMSKITSAM